MIGEVRDEDSDPRSMPNPGPGAPGLDVKNWATGYFGSIIECVDEEIGVDRRCELPPAPGVVEDPPPIEETITELVEVPVMLSLVAFANKTKHKIILENLLNEFDINHVRKSK